SPTRNPVNDPGPVTATSPSRSCAESLYRVSRPEICGISSAENVPPWIPENSIIWNSLALPRARVIPPWRPEVSTASSSILDGADRVLAEFKQDAAGRGGMNEYVEMPAGADLDFVGDKAHAAALEVFESLRNVVHVDGNMVQSFAAFGNKFGDHGVVGSGLQQFKAGFTNRQHRGTDFLVFNDLFADNSQAELLVEAPRAGDALHRDSEMIDFIHAVLQTCRPYRVKIGYAPSARLSARLIFPAIVLRDYASREQSLLPVPQPENTDRGGAQRFRGRSGRAAQHPGARASCDRAAPCVTSRSGAHASCSPSSPSAAA